MKKKWLTDSQYNTCMKALGYTYDEELGKFFKCDSAFLMNIIGDINEVEDLIIINKDGHPAYMSKAICEFMDFGAKLTIGDGAIDGFGIKYKKGLYCTNYRELFSNKNKVRSKKVVD